MLLELFAAFARSRVVVVQISAGLIAHLFGDTPFAVFWL